MSRTNTPHYRYTLDEFEQRRRKLNNPLTGVLTVNEVCYFYDKSRKTVLNALALNKLIYRKADADEGERGGTYLIEKISCDWLWGKTHANVYYREDKPTEEEGNEEDDQPNE